MKRGSSLRFMEWPIPQMSGEVRGWLMMASQRGTSPALRLAQLLGRVLHGLHDVHVPRAPAQVPGDGLADLELARRPVPLEERVARHHHARRAVAALEPVHHPEAPLDGVEPAV